MFTQINGIKDILNSEGPILRLLEKTDAEPDQHNLYVEGLLKEGDGRILCRISPETVRLYLNGRLRTKELFLVRSDEEFFTGKGNAKRSVRFGERLRERINEDLACGNYFYTDLPEGMKSHKDPSEIMRFIDLFW
jgi:hypothetical protein